MKQQPRIPPKIVNPEPLTTIDFTRTDCFVLGAMVGFVVALLTVLILTTI